VSGLWIAIAVGLVLVGGLGLCAGPFARHEDRVEHAWRQAAVDLGLILDESPYKLSGRVRDWKVEVGRLEGEKSGVATRVSNRRLLPSSVVLVRESTSSSLVKSIRSREDLLTGDPFFDREVFVGGPPAETLARLDADERRKVRAALAVRSTKIEGGEIVRELLRELSDSTHLVRQVEGLVAAADALCLEKDVPDELAENVECEVIPEVRLQNLRALLRVPSHPAATRASRVACGDRDPRLRLEGATLLGDEGFPVLAALIDPPEASEGNARSQVPIAIRVEALRRLVTRCDAARVSPILRRQIETGTNRLLEAAIEGAGKLRVVSPLPDLRKRIAGADEEVALAITTAVSEIGDPSADVDLLQLLGHGSSRVREHAAKALGEHGSVRAVPALRELLAGSTAQRGLQRAAERAIRRIQERLEGAEAGQVALVDGTTARTGALSLAGGQGGEVALADAGPSRDSSRSQADPASETSAATSSSADAVDEPPQTPRTGG
jgi:hypothetical protein